MKTASLYRLRRTGGSGDSGAANDMSLAAGRVSSGTPAYIIMLAVLDVLAVLALAAAEVFTVRSGSAGCRAAPSCCLLREKVLQGFADLRSKSRRQVQDPPSVFFIEIGTQIWYDECGNIWSNLTGISENDSAGMSAPAAVPAQARRAGGGLAALFRVR